MGTQQSLEIGDPPEQDPTAEPQMAAVAQARTSDPPTSHEAAASVDTTAGQRLVAALIYRHVGTTGDFTLDELVQWTVTDRTPISASGARSRCKELVVKGWVIRTGDHRILSSKRRALLHRLVQVHSPEPTSITELLAHPLGILSAGPPAEQDG